MFVAACCSWPHSETTQARVIESAKSLKNWDEVKECVIRHRVIPLVNSAVKNLETVPESFRDWARKEAQKVAAHSLQITHDCIKIDAALKAAGVEPLHFKGPVLAQMAYGSVALKFSNDLDIFVSKREILSAFGVLKSSGFQIADHIERATESQISALVHNFKDACFVNSSGRLIELHWKFTNTNMQLSEIEQNPQRIQVEVANLAKLDTLNSTQTLTYLGVHGARHHWVRLKWLADFSAFLNALSSQQRTQSFEHINKSSNRDTFAQALKLCDTLLGTCYSPKMSHRASKLYEYSLMRIQDPYLPGNRPFIGIILAQHVFLARHLPVSFWAKFQAIADIFYHKDDVLALPLPRALNWIYPLIRLPCYVVRRFKSL